MIEAFLFIAGGIMGMIVLGLVALQVRELYRKYQEHQQRIEGIEPEQGKRKKRYRWWNDRAED
jgi:Tfp pilus assembly protein PilV